jgi:hypothetical protein
MRDLTELDAIRDTDRERLMGFPSWARKWGGVFRMPIKGYRSGLLIIASAGDDPETRSGWDHVSASLPNRCPTWDEMCRVKDRFFLPTERAFQLHPMESENISNHPYCLHIWRPVHADLPVPPSYMVGIKELGDLITGRKG